jgi:hypothetical protein
MRQALRRHWKTILRIAVISAVAVEGYTSGTNLGIVVAVAEGLLLLLLLIHLPRIATIYRVSRRDHGDRWRAMEGAIAEEAGTRFAKFAMLEAKLWWSLATWLLRRPLPAGSFAYGRNSLAWGLVAVVVVSTPAEVLLFHFLLPWQWLKTLTLILAVYGVFWIVGYAASMSRFPHMVSDRALLVRFGAMDDVVIPWPIISSVEVNRKKFLAGASGVQAGDQPGEVAFVANGETQLLVQLQSPVTVQKAFGEVAGVRVLRLAADEPDWLEAAIRSRLRSADVDTSGFPVLDRGNPGEQKHDLRPAFQAARTDSTAGPLGRMGM